jgi:hypothetical protein
MTRFRGNRPRVGIAAVAALILASAGVTPQLAAGPVDIGASGSTTNKTGKVKNDLEITFTSDVTMNFIGADASGNPLGGNLSVNGGANVAANVTGNGTRMVTLTWNANIPINAGITVSALGVETKFNQFTTTTRFTPPDGPADLPSLGWQVNPNGDVYLMNQYQSAIHFSSLLFQFPAALTLDSLGSLVSSPPSGITGPITSGDVPGASASGAAGELFVGNFPLAPSSFLTATMDTSFDDQTFSSATMTDGLAHESVPEPSSLILLLIGGLGTLGGAVWPRVCRAR